ncbi:MAG TPA: glycosyltransferase family A protein [Phycisphaerae bacterium]|nr:glycosyltransferase family A protein [Phycisphaerae bacterium]
MTQDVLDVSVIMPAYYAEKVLARAIRSVLAQDYPVREIIVVADETTDGTAAVARGFGDPVRFYHQTNCGPSAARNLAMEKAGGEWVAFLDADDWWEPQRLALAADILKRHPELQWVSGRYTTIWPGGERTLCPRTAAYEALLDEGCHFQDFYAAGVAGVHCHTDTLLIRRDVVVQAGLFDLNLTCGEDIDLFYRIADRFPAIGYVNTPISVYDRSSEGSLERNKAIHLTDYLALLAKHVPAQVPADWKSAGSKERFFRDRIEYGLRLAAVRGEREILKLFLRDYGGWVSPRLRCLGAVLALFPGSILTAMGRAYLRCPARSLPKRWARLFWMLAPLEDVPSSPLSRTG